MVYRFKKGSETEPKYPELKAIIDTTTFLKEKHAFLRVHHNGYELILSGFITVTGSQV